MSDDDYGRQAELAGQLIELGQDARAMAILAQLLRDFPEDEGLTQTLLADAHLKADRNREALAAAHRAVACEPELAEAHQALARSLLEVGDYAGGERSARKALGINAEDARNYMLLAGALDEQGRKAEARDACIRAVELAPDEPYAHLFVGMLSRENPAVAERAFREAIRLDPSFSPAMLQLAIMRLTRKDEEGAARGIAGVAAADPGNPVVRSIVDVLVARVVQAVQNATLLGLFALVLVRAFGVVDEAASAVSILAATAVYAAFRAYRRARPLHAYLPNGGRNLMRSYFKRRRLIGLCVIELAIVWPVLIAATVWEVAGSGGAIGPAAAFGVVAGIAGFFAIGIQFRHEFD